MARKKCIYTKGNRAVRGLFIEEQRKCQVLDFACLGKSYTVNRQTKNAEDISLLITNIKEVQRRNLKFQSNNRKQGESKAEKTKR